MNQVMCLELKVVFGKRKGIGGMSYDVDSLIAMSLGGGVISFLERLSPISLFTA
jgi:hypothetical protein